MLVKIRPTNLAVVDWRRLTLKTTRLVLLKRCLHLSGRLGKVRLVIYGLPIFKTLPIDCLDRLRDPLAIIHRASIPAELKLVQVIRQMLAADNVERSHHATANQGKYTFDGV